MAVVGEHLTRPRLCESVIFQSPWGLCFKQLESRRGKNNSHGWKKVHCAPSTRPGSFSEENEFYSVTQPLVASPGPGALLVFIMAVSVFSYQEAVRNGK